ncbi:hypothetical protein TRVA0_013S02278 [Trichomonascus vanleenenianus]|uniref:uncharacterized protein n=1 Tax=Trichomonascus vanleenenianus TaxID=2268995 RepID=UPI003ECB45F5
MNLKVTLLVAGMLITGCANSLLNKLQDNTCIGNCDAPVQQRKHFEEPVFQTAQMFLAEMCCWVFYRALKTRSKSNGYESVNTSNSSSDVPELKGRKVWLLATPAVCDICGTTLMNVGLLFVPVSIFQMTRGALVLFVGFMSIMFLKHRITPIQWAGLTSVTLGVFLVGLSATLGARQKVVTNEVPVRSPMQVTSGILMILFGQIFTATQFVVEEHILNKYQMEPLKTVAWEGTFGTGITLAASLVIYSIFKGTSPAIEVFNLYHAASVALEHNVLIIAGLCIMVSIASFNYCGLSVTRSLSATARSTIDTCRTLGIWVVSLIIGWESFRSLQLAGFGLLVYGTLMFNGLIHGEDIEQLDPRIMPEHVHEDIY